MTMHRNHLEQALQAAMSCIATIEEESGYTSITGPQGPATMDVLKYLHNRAGMILAAPNAMRVALAFVAMHTGDGVPPELHERFPDLNKILENPEHIRTLLIAVLQPETAGG